ncbi:MAG: endonuclease [Bacteroidota bacterium]|nr:endonuclease [Bacteroidota bacterium]
MSKTLTLLLVQLILSTCAGAQWSHQDVFRTDSGILLINKLVDAYKPSQVLDYSNARIKMYKEIYNVADSVSCVYSKHTLYLDPNDSDPIGYLIKNNNPSGINCEHTFPQSKGAENGNARSDIHHLFPSRAAVNQARSNYLFGEIDDQITDHWFFKNLDLTIKPNQVINEYSEGINGRFEPREDHKGNVARAIFYFWTMYEVQSDRSFFESMKTTLCGWHVQDPVDSLEWIRTFLIAKYQEDKANPFVLDCSLARRSYCPTQSPCLVNKSDDIGYGQLKIAPVPVENDVFIHAAPLGELDIKIFDIVGKLRFHEERLNKDDILKFNITTLSSSIYHILIQKDRQAIFRGSFVKE